MRQARIAFLVNCFPVVSETFVLRQITGLLDAGDQVDVICSHRGDLTTLHINYLRHGLAERTRPIRKQRNGTLAKAGLLTRFFLTSLLAPRRLLAAIRAYMAGLPDIAADIVHLADAQALPRYDYVIAHFGTGGVLAMHLQQAGLLQGTLLTVFHGYDLSVHDVVRRYLPAYRQLFAHPGRCLPISEFWRQRLLGWGCPAEKIRVLRMGVDVEQMSFPSPHRPLSSPLRVLSVARLTEKKGIEYGIRALPGCSAEYTIIGSGELLDALQELARTLGVDERVHFLGEQSHETVFEHLQQSDIFLLPSITASSGDMEGIPVALMEAMASGILTVSTRHSGIPELIEDGVTGFLVEERDASGISGVLNTLASARHDLASLRVMARSHVEKHFNARTLDTQLLALLDTGEEQAFMDATASATR
ncbi:MAG: colanic acid biosynthesis glycosyltransferase WcaL [Rhodocyclales bacterium]|nr:colanic acid biosynthesis glycosyltransferase WcaL [Rhodocyclales bacterium]